MARRDFRGRCTTRWKTSARDAIVAPAKHPGAINAVPRKLSRFPALPSKLSLNVPPVDLTHLRKQTGGDHALELEVLRMFAARSVADLSRLKQATADDRRAIAHLIVGSARAIGAGDVARHAASVEAGADDLVPLEAAIAAAGTFIAEYLGE